MHEDECVGDADREGGGVLASATRGGTLPFKGDGVGGVLGATRGVGAVQPVDKHVRVQERVGEQDRVHQGGGEVVNHSRVAVQGVGKGGVEALQNLLPRDPKGEGFAKRNE